jgi:hypothetical protein
LIALTYGAQSLSRASAGARPGADFLRAAKKLGERALAIRPVLGALLGVSVRYN